MEIFIHLITSLRYNIITRKPYGNCMGCWVAQIFIFFFPSSIRMSGKEDFQDKKTNKSNFYKNKKLFLKKNDIAQKIHINASLDIMMMMSFGHYVQSFLE